MVSVTCLNGSVLAICSGMMNGTLAPPLPIASMNIGNGCLSVILIVRSSCAPQLSTNFHTVWPIVSRAAQRFRLGAQSCARTGSPLWNFSPSRSLIRYVRPSSETV